MATDPDPSVQPATKVPALRLAETLLGRSRVSPLVGAFLRGRGFLRVSTASHRKCRCEGSTPRRAGRSTKRMASNKTQPLMSRRDWHLALRRIRTHGPGRTLGILRPCAGPASRLHMPTSLRRHPAPPASAAPLGTPPARPMRGPPLPSPRCRPWRNGGPIQAQQQPNLAQVEPTKGATPWRGTGRTRRRCNRRRAQWCRLPAPPPCDEQQHDI